MPKKAVVVGLVSNNEAAEVKDRQGKQAFADQKQGVQDAASATISVSERMDGFELVMGSSHSNEGIDFSMFVKVTFPIGQEGAQKIFADGRRVNDFTIPTGERCSRDGPDAHFPALYQGADFLRGAGGEGT